MSEQTETPQTNPVTLHSLLEAVLFVASGPITPAQLAAAVDLPATVVEEGLRELGQHYLEGHGIRLQWHGGRVQLTTAAETAPVLEKFLGLEVTSRLSRAAFEALAIIAYQQPVTRPQLDSIRGVNSDGVLKSLLGKGLIQEVGRSDAPGRPILFGTTVDFLQYFGLNSLQDLPPLELEVKEGETRTNGYKLLKD
ncbi:MAG TPA: SMC-Scp complex subunit ScpB [Anaerolineaceae bacterium]|nr:SMC-Scp complex subunit ScpB [Anaerolineaceae bacterium]